MIIVVVMVMIIMIVMVVKVVMVNMVIMVIGTDRTHGTDRRDKSERTNRSDINLIFQVTCVELEQLSQFLRCLRILWFCIVSEAGPLTPYQRNLFQSKTALIYRGLVCTWLLNTGIWYKWCLQNRNAMFTILANCFTWPNWPPRPPHPSCLFCCCRCCCKWSSERSGLLQRITRMIRPLANDHLEGPATCKC